MTRRKQNDQQLSYIRLSGIGNDVFGVSVPDRITITRRDWEEIQNDLEIIFSGPKRIILYFGKSSVLDKDLREFFATESYLQHCKKMVVVLQDEFQEVLMHGAAHERIADGIITLTYSEKEAEKFILR
jgi:hypothetical protein